MKEDFINHIEVGIDSKKGDENSKKWLKESIKNFVENQDTLLRKGEITDEEFRVALNMMKKSIEDYKTIEKQKIEARFKIQQNTIRHYINLKIDYLKTKLDDQNKISCKEYVNKNGYKEVEGIDDHEVRIYDKKADNVEKGMFSSELYDYVIEINDPEGIKEVINDTITTYGLKTSNFYKVSITYLTANGVRKTKMVDISASIPGAGNKPRNIIIF